MPISPTVMTAISTPATLLAASRSSSTSWCRVCALNDRFHTDTDPHRIAFPARFAAIGWSWSSLLLRCRVAPLGAPTKLFDRRGADRGVTLLAARHDPIAVPAPTPLLDCRCNLKANIRRLLGRCLEGVTDPACCASPRAAAAQMRRFGARQRIRRQSMQNHHARDPLTRPRLPASAWRGPVGLTHVVTVNGRAELPGRSFALQQTVKRRAASPIPGSSASP